MGNLFHGSFPDQATIRLRNPGFTEIFLGQDICSNLTPSPGHFHVRHLKYDFSGGIANDRTAVIIFKLVKYRNVVAGVTPAELQTFRRLRMSSHKMEMLYVVRKIVSLLTNR